LTLKQGDVKITKLLFSEVKQLKNSLTYVSGNGNIVKRL